MAGGKPQLNINELSVRADAFRQLRVWSWRLAAPETVLIVSVATLHAMISGAMPLGAGMNRSVCARILSDRRNPGRREGECPTMRKDSLVFYWSKCFCYFQAISWTVTLDLSTLMLSYDCGPFSVLTLLLREKISRLLFQVTRDNWLVSFCVRTQMKTV